MTRFLVTGRPELAMLLRAMLLWRLQEGKMAEVSALSNEAH